MEKDKKPNLHKEVELLYASLKGYRGAFAQLAKLTGKTREWNRRVLKGDERDEGVIKIAADLLKEIKVKTQEKEDRLAVYVNERRS